MSEKVGTYTLASINIPLTHRHKALYLPPKILHNLCFSLRLGIAAIPRAIENNGCAKFGGGGGGGGQIRHIMGNVQVVYGLFYD